MLCYTGIKYQDLCEHGVLVSDVNVKKYVEEQWLIKAYRWAGYVRASA